MQRKASRAIHQRPAGSQSTSIRLLKCNYATSVIPPAPVCVTVNEYSTLKVQLSSSVTPSSVGMPSQSTSIQLLKCNSSRGAASGRVLWSLSTSIQLLKCNSQRPVWWGGRSGYVTVNEYSTLKVQHFNGQPRNIGVILSQSTSIQLLKCNGLEEPPRPPLAGPGSQSTSIQLLKCNRPVASLYRQSQLL